MEVVNATAPGEMVEKELDSFIARRSRQNDPDRDREDLWAASCRAYNARLAEQHLWDRLLAAEDRIRAHEATFGTLIARHEEEAFRCRLALGLTKLEYGVRAANTDVERRIAEHRGEGRS